MKVGDEIVCIFAPPDASGYVPVVKGRVYLLLGIVTCQNCGHTWFDVGILPSGDFQECGRCAPFSTFPGHTVWVSYKLFRPIEYNSAHEELLNKEVVEEKLDIPVKEPQKQES